MQESNGKNNKNRDNGPDTLQPYALFIHIYPWKPEGNQCLNFITFHAHFFQLMQKMENKVFYHLTFIQCLWSTAIGEVFEELDSSHLITLGSCRACLWQPEHGMP